MEQKAHGLEVWMQPLRAPKLFNLRSDPFGRSEQNAKRIHHFCCEPRVLIIS
jgi:hypothetical protein